jgi:hypothetical protein
MNVKRYSLIFTLALLVVFVSITASVQAQEEELPFTVKVVDSASGAAIKNIIVTIESVDGGVSEQKMITGSEGSGCTILPPGTYRLKAQFTIFGIPIQISSTEITLDEPTEFIYQVSTFIIPIEYIPTAVYGTTGVLALSGIYGTGKRLLGLRGIPKSLATGAACGVSFGGSVWKPPARPKDLGTGIECGIVIEGTVWKPPERPKDPATGDSCGIMTEGTVWKPPERPKDPATGESCGIMVEGTVWKPPERPKDPATGESCGIMAEGTVWKPPERPKDPATGESCNIITKSTVWKPPERPKDPATGESCGIMAEGSVWKPPERPKDPATGESCGIMAEGTVWKPPERPKDPATGES